MLGYTDYGCIILIVIDVYSHAVFCLISIYVLSRYGELYVVETYRTKSKRKDVRYTERYSAVSMDFYHCTFGQVHRGRCLTVNYIFDDVSNKTFENRIIKFVELSNLMFVVSYATFTGAINGTPFLPRPFWYPLMVLVRIDRYLPASRRLPRSRQKAFKRTFPVVIVCLLSFNHT